MHMYCKVMKVQKTLIPLAEPPEGMNKVVCLSKLFALEMCIHDSQH